MPNLQGRQVPVESVTPRSLQQFDTTALMRLPRDEGQGLDQIAASTRGLAATLGQYADEAAQTEGKSAGAAAGLDRNFDPNDRPSDATIRGRAFAQGYVDTLDAQTRADMQSVYQANKDDPAALGNAFDAMHAEYMNKHVFPSVLGPWSASFIRLRSAYINQATTNAQNNESDANKATLITNLNTVDTSTKASIATLDPNTPGVEDIVRSGIAKKSELYDQAAQDGVISQAAAVNAKLKSTREDLQAFYLSRAQKLTDAASVQKFSDQLATDFHNGKLRGLDGEGFTNLQADLTTLAKKRQIEGNALSRGLSSQLDDYVTRVANGQTPPQQEWQTLLTTAHGVADGDSQVALAQAKVALATKLRSASVEDGDTIMRTLRQQWRDNGGVDAQRKAVLDFGDKYVADYKRQLATDQLGAAQSRGLIASVTPLDFAGLGAKPDDAGIAALAGQVTARVAQAHAVAQTLSREPQYLRPEETQRLRELVKQGGLPAMAVAAAIAKGASEDAGAVFHQIGGEAPLLAQAGVLMANGGSLSAARDAFNFAQLKATSQHDIPTIDNATQLSTDKSTLGQAFLLQPGDGIRVRQTAEAIARYRVSQEGLDPKADTARVKEIYDRALREASGAVYVGNTQYGGVADYKAPAWWFGGAQVVVPSGVRTDKFRDVIGAIKDEDLAAQPNPPMHGATPYHAADLQGLIPIATRNGYAFAQKSFTSGGAMSYVTDARGQPFVLDWKAIEPALRARVPDAFMGTANQAPQPLFGAGAADKEIDFLKQLSDHVRINQAAWDKFIATQEPSANIEDRRGENSTPIGFIRNIVRRIRSENLTEDLLR